MKKLLQLFCLCLVTQGALGAAAPSSVTSLDLVFGLNDEDCRYKIQRGQTMEEGEFPSPSEDDMIELDEGRIELSREGRGTSAAFIVYGLDIFPLCKDVTITQVSVGNLRPSIVIYPYDNSESKPHPIEKLRVDVEEITLGDSTTGYDQDGFLIKSLEVVGRDFVPISVIGRGKINGRTYSNGLWLASKDGSIVPYSFANIRSFLSSRGSSPIETQKLEAILAANWDPRDGMNDPFEVLFISLPKTFKDGEGQYYFERNVVLTTVKDLVNKTLHEEGKPTALMDSFLASHVDVIQKASGWTKTGETPVASYVKIDPIKSFVTSLEIVYNQVKRFGISGEIPDYIYGLRTDDSDELLLDDCLFRIDLKSKGLIQTSKSELLQDLTAESRATMSEIKKKMDNLDARVDTFNAEKAALLQQLSESKKLHSDSLIDKANLSSQVSQLTEKLKSLSADLALQERTKMDLVQTTTKLEASDMQRARFEVELSQLKIEMAVAKERLSTQAASLQGKMEKQPELEKRIDVLLAEKAMVEKELITAKVLAEQKGKAYDNASQSITMLTQQLQAKTEQYARSEEFSKAIGIERDQYRRDRDIYNERLSNFITFGNAMYSVLKTQVIQYADEISKSVSAIQYRYRSSPNAPQSKDATAALRNSSAMKQLVTSQADKLQPLLALK